MLRKALYVHGLYTYGPEALLLTWRLRQRGIALKPFHYASLREAPAHVAERLARRISREPETHLIGHSLGGLIVVLAIRGVPAWQGRAVLLGPPLVGSALARRITRLGLGRIFLGAARSALIADFTPQTGTDRVAIIAGLRNFGMGPLLGACPPPADGIVRLAETRLPGSPRRVARATHIGLLFDHHVANAAADFILTGHLARPRAAGVHRPDRAPHAG